MRNFYEHLSEQIEVEIREFIRNKYSNSTTNIDKELIVLKNVDTQPKIGFEKFKIVDLEPVRNVKGETIWKAVADMNVG